MFGYYIVFIAPALLLALWAQMKIKSSYAQASQVPSRMSGAAAARKILDRMGIHDVEVKQVPGFLSDHYDPRRKVLCLSEEVFHGRSMASVGIAAHEVGHAIQDAHRYLPLVVRNAAVPAASFGSNASLILLVLGAIIFPPLIWVGILLFGVVVFFQLVNLPVEFDASSRAKDHLVEWGIISQQELPHVRKVLNASAMTYVAATLQAIFTLLFYILRLSGNRR